MKCKNVTDRIITVQDVVKEKMGGKWIKIIVVYKNPYQLAAALPLAMKLSGKGNGLMYFARYTSPPYRIEFQVLTKMSLNALRQIIMGFKYNGVKPLVVKFEPCTGSVAHALAFNLVATLRLDNQLHMGQMQDVMHWAYNMAGFSYIQEASSCAQHAANILRVIPGWTHEPLFGPQLKGATLPPAAPAAKKAEKK